jgi:hypothetical protein
VLVLLLCETSLSLSRARALSLALSLVAADPPSLYALSLACIFVADFLIYVAAAMLVLFFLFLLLVRSVCLYASAYVSIRQTRRKNKTHI